MATYGYTRVSTVEQTNGSSIADQERRIQGAMMIRGDADPVFYSDPGISGSMPLAGRPNGAEMVARLQRGDTIIAAKLDRLFRSASDALVMVEQLQSQGVDVILVDMGTEPVTSSGASKMFFTLLAAFAEFERGRILERMNDGRKAKRARAGHIGGQAPYGYRIVGSGRDATLEPNLQEQAIIDHARVAQKIGMTLRQISDYLAAKRFMSRADRPFDAMQIKRMLEYEPPA